MYCVIAITIHNSEETAGYIFRYIASRTNYKDVELFAKHIIQQQKLSNEYCTTNTNENDTHAHTRRAFLYTRT